MDPLQQQIAEDIFVNRRGFLPGKPCTESQVEANFSRAIEADGLTEEQRYLLLSTIPAETARVWISPLDKGLSGSTVILVRFSGTSGICSKQFVAKLGESPKLERELQAVQEVALPFIPGISAPVFRKGPSMSILLQDFAGLGNHRVLDSFRNYSRTNADCDRLIDRLFTVRFANWYAHPLPEQCQFQLKSLFSWYLTKAPTPNLVYPDRWRDLQDDVKAFCGMDWSGVPSQLSVLLERSIQSPKTPVHGDLHSQNILVDDTSECWPIDFAWARMDSSPLIDLAMLECSLKYLAIPAQTELFSLLRLELALLANPFSEPPLGNIPCAAEIGNIFRGIVALRRLASEHFHIDITDYLRGVAVMTYCSAAHPRLNRPYLLSCLQLMLGSGGLLCSK